MLLCAEKTLQGKCLLLGAQCAVLYSELIQLICHSHVYILICVSIAYILCFRILFLMSCYIRCGSTCFTAYNKIPLSAMLQLVRKQVEVYFRAVLVRGECCKDEVGPWYCIVSCCTSCCMSNGVCCLCLLNGCMSDNITSHLPI